MKTIITFLFLSLGLICLGQTNEPKYNRAFVIYEGCDAAEDTVKCFQSKSTQFITKNLTDSLQQILI